jgi:capsular polysaccharide transport system ATP-binding protein
MIVFENVSKFVVAGRSKRAVLDSVNVTLPTNHRIAFLGTSEEDRRLVINCIGGQVLPTSGRIMQSARVSFPVGSLAGFQADLSIRVNVAHVARLYDTDAASVVSFVEKLADLGAAFDRPYRELPKPQRQMLGQIFGYSIPFDVYLLIGDITRMARPMRDIVYMLFQERSREAGMIISTRNIAFAREYCDMALLLHEGGLYTFDSVEDAVRAMEESRMQEAFGN